MSDTLSTAFREAFRCHPAGVAVLTADAGQGPVAMTVSSLISVSAAPPIIGFSLSAMSSAAKVLLEAGGGVVHLLRYADLGLANLAATPGADRFGADVVWERLPTGEPRYISVATWFRLRVLGALPVGGATLVAAQLVEGQVGGHAGAPEAESLIYLDRRWHRLREEVDGSVHRWLVDVAEAGAWL